MTTKIEKCKSLKPIIIGENNTDDYTDVSAPTEMDQATLVTLIKTIPKLDKKAHECIYELIRGVKPVTFFATNGLGTHFNIFSLNNKIKWELHRLCQMSLQDINRKSVIQSADAQHGNVLESLDKTLN